MVSYDAWGLPETAAIASFGFTGEVQQGSDVWLRARWYGAGRGGFGSRDPYAGDAQTPYSMMPYQYAYAAPTMWMDPSGKCTDSDGESPHLCEAARKSIEAYGFSLDDEDNWPLAARRIIVNALGIIQQGTGWSIAEVRLAATGHGNYHPKIIRNTASDAEGTGNVDPYQDDGIVRMTVSLLGGKEKAYHTFIHEFAHVWDNTLLNALSNGFMRATGGHSEAHTDYTHWPSSVTTYTYYPGECINYPIPNYDYGAGSDYKNSEAGYTQKEDWAERFLEVVAPQIAIQFQRHRDRTNSELWIDGEERAGGQRKRYVQRQIHMWPNDWGD